ncbi:unnamed protein product [Rotaria magnacalcarata]|nr:unnamed protein product [Rotaria magnacalcarata]CAF1555654.1 unnamed protein product [Rotaria magnacalcarata]CAF2024450.1 unnamed protein product [Rotaria magnacalcarata]CAF2030514.1 unnamed protein product [Rotaria magnacalcarata]CAF4110695.1 unnamed protein product [Rotaria magnacalcarata]
MAACHQPRRNTSWSSTASQDDRREDIGASLDPDFSRGRTEEKRTELFSKPNVKMQHPWDVATKPKKKGGPVIMDITSTTTIPSATDEAQLPHHKKHGPVDARSIALPISTLSKAGETKGLTKRPSPS